MTNKEIFFFNADIEVEETKKDGDKISGYFMKYGGKSLDDRGGYVDVFEKNVFGEDGQISPVEGFDVKAFFNHNQNDYLARTNNGTLELETDDVGVKFKISLPSTSLGNDVKELIKRGDVNAMSFGYAAEEFRFEDDGQTKINTQGKLYEISIVFDPAFSDTDLQLNNLEIFKKSRLEQYSKWQKENESFINRNEAQRILQMNGQKF